VLGMKTYEAVYVDGCRNQLDAQLAAYDALVADAQADVVAAFAPRFFAGLVVVLDAYFTHRLRTVEGKDGNPLNEVRMMAESITANHGVLAANPSIKYKPDQAVLGLAIGDTIHLDRTDFQRLADAYFVEIRQKFT
jgi:hypothetical protein